MWINFVLILFYFLKVSLIILLDKFRLIFYVGNINFFYEILNESRIRIGIFLKFPVLLTSFTLPIIRLIFIANLISTYWGGG